MRVFHGLYNIAGIPATMARAERALGLKSTSVCFPSSKMEYASDEIEAPGDQVSDQLDRYKRHINDYDIFVFHFGLSFSHDTLADIPLLKEKNKTVIFFFHGCDARQSKETIKKHKFSACHECWPQLCSPNRDQARRVALEYADKIWVSTPDLLEFVAGAELLPQPIDLSCAPYAAATKTGKRGQDRPIQIIHAPSDANLKGTKYVVAAIERLKNEGVPVELLLLQGIPHSELLIKLSEADFGIDQLLFGSYGTFSIELFAAGIPVVCYLRDDIKPLYPELPPLTVANPDTLFDVIKHMLDRQDDWSTFSAKGREYVERNHDAAKIAQRTLNTYTELRRGR